MERLIENLENRNQHYLYPFFWQHGESLDVLQDYIDKMLEQGIYNLCIESRPHPDFLEAGWWETMDFIIQQAKQKDMKIWILDDAKFPTGYANGKVPENLKKKYLQYRRFDIVGPNPHAELNLSTFVDMREYMKAQRHQHDQFFKAILVENQKGDEKDFQENTLQDVSNQFNDGILHLSLENKHYSVFILFQTVCGEEVTQDYLDPMNQEATQVLIDEVYEKHYQHYQKEFGKTIVGFFSDEPRFGNIKGTQASIGRLDMPLPWNTEVYEKLKLLDDFADEQLIFLFLGKSERAHQLRFAYMDIITKLYSQNFSQYIGQWCEEKGVDYVGHVIEDNNAHARLGYGPGHYFRGIAGQTMAGIDIIGGQVVPGMDYQHEAFSTGGSDGEFFHYALVKMGASCAKLDPHKHGQLMCEAFGAYGWIEGLKMMKWMTDHMISHGVNVIVPHAFNPAKFPDWDCPPHFYAHGNNPQYQYFYQWAHYADRLCHLMSGGYHQAKVGVLYHAFAEWSGDYMLMQKVLKELQQHQIACDIISEDYFMNADIRNHSYIIHNYEYDVLVVPYAQRLPDNLLKQLKQLSQNIKVIFINDYPLHFINQQSICVTLENLSCELKNYSELILQQPLKNLIFYHYHQKDGEIYMFHNESTYETIYESVRLKTNENLIIYDAYENQTYQLASHRENEYLVFDLRIEPYQSVILLSGESQNSLGQKGRKINEIKQVDISMKAYNQLTYQSQGTFSLPYDLGKDFPRFSGQIHYCFEIELNQETLLSITDAYETVEVRVNKQTLATKIAPPYLFDLSKVSQSGKNLIEIIVTNTLSRNQRDAFSSYLALEPLGIVGKIELYEKVLNHQ